MFIRALKDSLPVCLCYLPLGIVYGAVFVEQGLPGYFAPLFCLFVFAGAMQFLALSFLSAGGSLPLLALALIPLGIRNLFYAIPMLDEFKHYRLPLRAYLAFGLVDATFAILSAQTNRPARYVVSLTVLNHLYWVVGSIGGVLLHSTLSIPPGLAFSMVAFFTATSVEHLLKTRQLVSLAVALTATFIALLLAPQHFFLIAALVALLICLFIPKLKRQMA